MLQVYLRTQAEIATEHDVAMDGQSNARWPVATHYRAINYAIREWGNRVVHPHIYEIPDGFISGTVDYALPDYVDGDIVPQFKMPGNEDTLSTSEEGWRDLARWEVYPSSTGSRTLTLLMSPHGSEGRVIWYATNGTVPITSTLPVTSAEVTAAATSLTLTTKPDVGRSGYIKIGSEWMFYAGLTEAASTITLGNLVRGLNGTTAAVHALGATVTWGVAVNNMREWTWMEYLAATYLHRTTLNRASGTQRDHHEFQYRLYRQLADEYSVQHVSAKRTRIRLNISPM